MNCNTVDFTKMSKEELIELVKTQGIYIQQLRLKIRESENSLGEVELYAIDAQKALR